jgi:hypothetical protein
MVDQKKRATTLIIGTIVMILLYLGWDAVEGYIARGKCVDQGGSWDASQQLCVLEADES